MIVPDHLDLPGADIDCYDVACLLITQDGRYLMQLRDDLPHLPLRNHWGLFGGQVEEGETLQQAMIRELQEELEFTPASLTRFTETTFKFLGRKRHHKTFFIAPILESDIAAMRQHEGAGKRLFRVTELLQEPLFVPWDVLGVILHARQDAMIRHAF